MRKSWIVFLLPIALHSLQCTPGADVAASLGGEDGNNGFELKGDTAASSSVPEWMPTPLEFKTRAEFEEYVKARQAEATDVDLPEGKFQIVNMGDHPMTFDREIPQVQFIKCDDEQYATFSYDKPIDWSTDACREPRSLRISSWNRRDKSEPLPPV